MYRSFLLIVGFSLFFVLTAQFGWWQPFAQSFHFLSAPVLASETGSTRKVINFFTLIATIRNLNKENSMLREKVNRLEAEAAAYKEVANENAILRQELNFTKESEAAYIPAQLIGRTQTGIIKDLIIDKGSKDGVQVNQAVVAQGYLVGKVHTVDSRQSTITLLTNPNALIPIVLQDSRSTGILRGGISGLTITDLLIDASVKQGENVITSGLGGELPSGILIGKIIEVKERKGDITKKATVSYPVDITRLEMVFVRKNP